MQRKSGKKLEILMNDSLFASFPPYQQHDFVNDFHDSHPHVYAYDWEHIDAPELGQEVWQHLKAAGIRTKRVERGIDHGVW